MGKVYLALYKGTGGSLYDRVTDWLIRKVTKGQYSHCEIAIERYEFLSGDYYPLVCYDCFTSSPRDGGVRQKTIDLKDGKWDLIELPNLVEAQVRAYFAKTQGCKYDWWGMLGIALGIKHKRSKFFCSEWCFNLIKNSTEGWRFSPNDLAAMIRGKPMT